MTRNQYSALWDIMSKDFRSSSSLRGYKIYEAHKIFAPFLLIYILIVSFTHAFLHFIVFTSSKLRQSARLLLGIIFTRNSFVYNALDWRTLKSVAYLFRPDFLDVFLSYTFSSQSSLLKLPTYNGIKQYLNYLSVQKLLSTLNHKQLRVCEIGAGTGDLALFLLKSNCISNYTIIDLPETLSSSKLNLSNYHQVTNFIDATTLDTSQYFDFDQFDIVINVESLAEMPRQSVHYYLTSIASSLQPHATFFSNNRLARLHEDAENLIDSTFFSSSCFLDYFKPSMYQYSSRFCEYRDYIMDKKNRNIIFTASRF